MPDRVEIYDTTLRDGGQALGVNLSLNDKLELSGQLDRLGVAYIEGGWPGSNPKDLAFFECVRERQFTTSKISAFGSTRHARELAESDPNLEALVASGADVCCIFGKSWDLHVHDALRVTLEENLSMIGSSVAFLRRATQRPVFFDAEHFFDGFRNNADYALQTLAAAFEAGAERVILCDTNGGALPQEVAAAVSVVRQRFPTGALGIHVHNDGGLAVANTLAAVEAGCTQVQGTMNGVGERCGNVDLTAVIANLELKLNRRCLPEGRLARLSELSRYVWERLNLVAPLNQPYVGKSAFAHKGGIHVSAVQRNPTTYEHVPPESVGNVRQILISEMSGRSNVLAKLANRYPQLSEPAVVGPILEEIQEKENSGYSFEGADGSFDLLVRRHLGDWQPAFELLHYRVHGLGVADGVERAVEATVKLRVKGEVRLCVAEGNGPVDAINHALLEALIPAFPQLSALALVDYKVRVVNSSDGTAAKVRVLVDHRFDGTRFATVGVSVNVIEASWQALVDAIDFAVHRI